MQIKSSLFAACAAVFAFSASIAAAQNPPPTAPPVKKTLKMDGMAVAEKPKKLEGVQKTLSGHVEVAGSKIYYEECGAGPSAVVLVHDDWLHSVTWDEVWKPLCVKYHVVRFDRRGYGRSDAAKAEFSPTDDVLALLKDRKIQRAVVVGSSSGAGLSVDFALAHPEWVEGLFLIGPVVDGIEVSPEFLAREEGNWAPLKQGDAKAAAENWSKDRYILGEGHGPARTKFYDELVANPQNLKNGGEFVAPFLPAAGVRLNEIHVPTEIVVGEFDISDIHAEAGAIEEGVSGAQGDVVINAGHLVQLEQPDIVLEKLTNFVDRQQHKAVDVTAEVLQSYQGTYKAGDRELTVKYGDSGLMAQAPGQASAPLFAESQTKFFFRISDVQVEFVKDAAGKVIRAVIYQDGETIKAARM
jgi:3-oxoadipate enol-lactonase